MRLIINGSTDPSYNLASEEYFLETARNSPENESTVMLWQNSPAVIIGRNQNAYAEIDAGYMREHEITLVRRLTGGGAVYHDKGNVCFTFIAPKTASGIDFRPFTEPVIRTLANLGVTATQSGRNDITVLYKGSEYKVSGNAQCTVGGDNGRQTVLSHGTLLFQTDLGMLGHALKPDPDKLSAKGIASVRSRVINLCELLPDMSCRQFFDTLASAFSKRYGEATQHTENERNAISKLAAEKYSSWEWNYGTSRQFSVRRKKRYPFGAVSIGIECDRGIITASSISGDFFGECAIDCLEQLLCGMPLEYEAILKSLEQLSPPIERYIAGIDAKTFALLLCGGC